MTPPMPSAPPLLEVPSESLRERVWTWLRDQQWMFVGTLWVVTLTLGYFGVREEFLATNTTRSAWDPLYRALQLFVMDDSMVVTGEIHGWKLELARFLAPLVSGYTAVLALLLFFHEQAAALMVRFARGHVVLCGLGRHGLELAQDLRRNQRRVVVIEINPDNEGISACRQAGITVLIGDATDEVMLVRARLATAQRLVALTGDDGTNVEVALVAHRLLSAEKTPACAVPQCLVHVTDLMLRTLLNQHPVFGNPADPFEVKVFNVYDSSVRLMFERHPLDGSGIAADAATVVHVVVIGCGRMGESVALHAVRTGHFANGKPLKLTVVDRAATAKRAMLLARFPGLESVCDARFIEGDINHLDTLRQVMETLRNAATLPWVVVAFDNDSAALGCALQLRAQAPQLDASILVRISEEGGLAALFEADGPAAAAGLAGIQVFGSTREVCTNAFLLDERRDALARRIFGLQGDEALWREIGPWQRDSFRQQADQLAVSLRALGRSPKPSGAAGAAERFTATETEVLARLEHARWLAERLLDGWVYNPGPEDAGRKASPWLRPWERLPAERQEECRAAIRRLEGVYEEVENGMLHHA